MQHVDTALIARLDAVTFACLQGRMNAVCDARNDRRLVAFFEWENLRCTMAPGIGNPAFDSVTLSGPVRLDDMAAALEAYRERACTPTIAINPGALSPELAELLSRQGFRHTGFDPMLLALASGLEPPVPAGVEVAPVSSEAMLERFADVYLQGWAIEDWLAPMLRSFIRHWPRQPGYALYLASLDGRAAGAAVLFLHDGVGYLADATTAPELRERGVQSALIAARVQRAPQSGARLMLGRAAFGSSSQRNQERAGLALRWVRALWTKA